MHKQIIAHLDMDSFYASVEIRDDPSLVGKPVIIGSDPQQGKGRGVVSTCSYEARKYGLQSGMPISRAWSLCPHGIFIGPSGKYGEVSAQIMNILHKYTGFVEQVSIDEAYLDLSAFTSYEQAESLIEIIKQDIVHQQRLTCSVGIAPARSYAKIASELQKPNGIFVITPENLSSVINDLPASKIPGVGRKSTAVLSSRGIKTIHDLAMTDIQDLQDIFGSFAVRVHTIASGRDTLGLREQGPQQSFGRDTTFHNDTSDPDFIAETIRILASSLQYELIREKARCRTVGIRIRYTGFITQTRAVSWNHADNHESRITRTALMLFNELWNGQQVRLVGIRLSGIVYQDPVQCSLDKFFSL
jgi:DNA polymerase IV (DinB-like DNA polymerase)